MNFFPPKIRKDDGKLVVDVVKRFRSPSLRIVLVHTNAHKLGKDVIFGIRPEDVHNPEFVPSGIHTAPVEAKVDVIELMGE